MRDVALEVVVGVALALLGVLVLYPFLGRRVWEIDPDIGYLVGAFAFSVPAIAVMEWRRRKRR
jgi:hypothetical protein